MHAELLVCRELRRLGIENVRAEDPDEVIGELWRTLDTLEARLGEGGPDASVQEVCSELVARLGSHNSKEEPIFYTQADTTLTASANAQLEAFLDSGQMPAGWVCQGVRS
jgi:hypothetical protein